jgi:predicted dehydrogenase
MNIAIIGCGLIAELHAKSLRAIGQSVDWVVDRNIDNAKTFAKKWDVRNYGDSLTDDLLDSVDSVHICTPPTVHYELVKECLLKGKHVICEKPLCLTKEESEELMILASEKNVVNAVNFNVRYYDACEKARVVISQEDFGKPLLIQCSYQQEFHALPETYSWRYRPEISGHLRATTEIGSHAIDLIRYWTGLTVTEVSAHFGCFNPVRHLVDGVMYGEEKDNSMPVNISSEDAAIISLRFSNGAIGNIVLSEVSHGRNNSIKLEVVGDNKSVWWESETPYHLNIARKNAGITSSINAFSQNFSDTIGQFIEQVYQDIHFDKREGYYPDFKDGFINSLICDAIYKSANNNASWVQLEEYK